MCLTSELAGMKHNHYQCRGKSLCLLQGSRFDTHRHHHSVYFVMSYYKSLFVCVVCACAAELSLPVWVDQRPTLNVTMYITVVKWWRLLGCSTRLCQKQCDQGYHHGVVTNFKLLRHTCTSSLYVLSSTWHILRMYGRGSRC